MREASKPHEVCGSSQAVIGADDASMATCASWLAVRARAPSRYPMLHRSARRANSRRSRLSVSDRLVSDLLVSGLIVSLLAMFTLYSIQPSHAQDPSTKTQNLSGTSSFPKQPGGLFGTQPRINNAAPLYLQGDDLIYDTRGRRIVARGNVQIFYNNYLLTGDQITYDQSTNRLIAEGNVQLRDPNGNITRAERIETTDDFRDAFVESLSVIARDETRIQARRSVRRDGNVTEFEQGKFTPCRTEAGQTPLWCISAARIVHDQQAATITYQDAQFELFGTPVLYLPYFQHSDPSVKHKTGFLTPSLDYSSKLGLAVELPYYFALDRSYGFTFNPRYLTRQGILYQGDWRQRLANGQYNVRFAAIDQKGDKLPGNLTDAERARLDGFRGSLETKGVFSLGSWWRAGWDVTLESDSSFRRFYGLDDILQTNRLNTVFLTGLSDRNYFNMSLYQLGGLVRNADLNSARAWVLPVTDYSYVVSQPVLGGELSFSGHARQMDRTRILDGADLVAPGTETQHVVAEMNWRRRMIDPIGQTWTPFANVRADYYSFSNAFVDPTDPLNDSVRGDSIFRGIGSAGLTYAYPFVAHSAVATQVIEPVAQIVTRAATKQVDQRLFPNEDAKSVVWDDNALFFESKATGFDRIDEGTRFNFGAKYTFQANNGFNARLVVGQSLHLSGTNVFADAGRDVTTQRDVLNMSRNNGLERDRSDYVAGLYLSPVSNLTLVAQARFGNENFALKRQDTLLSFAAGPLSAQLGYTYLQADPEIVTSRDQQELRAALGLRLTENWSLMGMVRYDLDEGFRLQEAVQLRYADDCFVLSASYSHKNYTDNGIGPDRTVMLRLEFKHLGSMQYRTDVASFLNAVTNQIDR